VSLLPIDTSPAQATGDRFLDARSSEHIARLLEASVDVQRRHQFFNWASSQLHPLAPHRVLVCGHYQRQSRALQFDCFYSVPLSADTVNQLSEGGGDLLRVASAAWIEGHGFPLVLELERFAQTAASDEAERLSRETACPLLMVHGMSRPQRLEEIECLFVLACQDSVGLARHLLHLRMVLPTLHAAWRRVQSQQVELRGAPRGADVPRRVATASPRLITERESEVLGWVRDGMSNQQIAARLGISPLTVKNHMQKLLRKLGAGNRAQAVALALAQNLLPRHSNPRDSS
jgi:transcriptional regulator EpsA